MQVALLRLGTTGHDWGLGSTTCVGTTLRFFVRRGFDWSFVFGQDMPCRARRIVSRLEIGAPLSRGRSMRSGGVAPFSFPCLSPLALFLYHGCQGRGMKPQMGFRLEVRLWGRYVLPGAPNRKPVGNRRSHGWQELDGEMGKVIATSRSIEIDAQAK